MNSLYNKDESVSFYDRRYKEGYMSDWPLEKRQRVYDIIKKIPLPKKGKALDFGCGNGVFTDVIKKTLPEWDVYGCDISKVSIDNASLRFPDCSFFVPSENLYVKEFDFVFTHHVLEHVYDLNKTLEEINLYLRDTSIMFHIFPCGNEGSFEHKVASIRKDGINENMGNRFFFEDEGHLRRLTTKEISDFWAPYSFHLVKEYYSNQYHGAIKWILETGYDFILKFTDASQAKDISSSAELTRLRKKILRWLRLKQRVDFYKKIKQRTRKSLRDRLFLLVAYIPFKIGAYVLNGIDRRAEREWKTNSGNLAGSEMYLVYLRNK